MAGSLRLDLAAFRELEAFAQLGTDLDAATQMQLDRGYRMVELLKQPQYKPLHVAEQVISIYAGTKGFLDEVSVADVGKWEAEFVQFLNEKRTDVLNLVKENLNNGNALKKADDEVTKAVVSALEEFNRTFKA